MLLLASSLLFGALALAAAQSPDLSSALSSGGDRTSLIFAATQPPIVTNGTGSNGTNGTTTGTGGPMIPHLLNGTGSGTTAPPHFTIMSLNGTNISVNGTLTASPNGTGGPMLPPLNWTLPGVMNQTHNGTAVFPTFPSFNFSVPNLNLTRPNGTFVFPTFSPLNWTLPGLNLTHNGTLVFPTFPPMNWTLPGLNLTNGTFVFPTFPPLNWTFPGLNFTNNGTLLFPTFPPMNWTLPGWNLTHNGTFVFPTFPPLNWTIPGVNLTRPNGTFPTLNSTVPPPLNLSLPFSTPRPVTNSTVVLSTTTTRPFSVPGFTSSSKTAGTGSTARWTPPAWSAWNQTITPRPGTTGPTTSPVTTRSPFGITRSPLPQFSTGAWFFGSSTYRSPLSTGSPVSFGTTTARPAVPGVTAGFTVREPFGGVSTTTRSPFITGAPFVSTSRPGFPGFTPGTGATTRFPLGSTTTSTRSPLFTDVPNLSDMLQKWRTRFAADMDAVRMNITQFLLH